MYCIDNTTTCQRRHTAPQRTLCERLHTVALFGLLVALNSPHALAQATNDAEQTSKRPAEAPAVRDALVDQVVAEGVGSSTDEALKDAFRNAVRQVVGAVVDAETLINNDELIDDKVMTYSDGFIKKYVEVPGSKKVRGGLQRIKIKATVERRSVIQKLSAVNIKLKGVDGKGMFAEVATKLEGEAGAKALIAKEFDSYPANVLQGVIKGKPSVETKGGDTILTCEVEISVDPARYDTFQKKSVDLLRRVARRKGECFVVANNNSRDSQEKRMMMEPQSKSSYGQAWWTGKLSPGDDIVVVVNTKRNGLNDRTTWEWFHVPRPGGAIDQNDQVEIGSTFAKNLSVNVLFLDTEGQEIVRHSQQLCTYGHEYCSPGMSVQTVRYGSSSGYHNMPFAMISPYFFRSEYDYKLSMPIKVEMKIAPEELKRISVVKTEIRVIE